MSRQVSRRVAAVLAALVLAACDASPGPAPSASPSSTASVSVSPSPSSSPSPAALGPPAAGATVIGVIGDFGVDDLPVRRVVATMDRFGPLAAVVTTGDNAYEKGTRSQAAFARRVLDPLVDAGTRMLASLGNHDVSTASGRHVLSAFGMPARWYTAVVGPVEFVVLDSNRTADPDQLGFLDGALRAPRRTPFRVAVFHHPALACSFHGPSSGVVRNFVPRLRGKVDLVLSGHNHSYERFAGADGMPYVTTGGGGASLYPSLLGLCQGEGRNVLFRTVYHAVRLVVTARELVLEAVGTDLRVFDRLVLRTAGND